MSSVCISFQAAAPATSGINQLLQQTSSIQKECLTSSSHTPPLHVRKGALARLSPIVTTSSVSIPGVKLASSFVGNGLSSSNFLFGEGRAYQHLVAAAASGELYDTSSGDRVLRRGGGAINAEMNIFARIGRIINAFIGGVVSDNEDPEKLLDQAVEEMGSDLAKLRQTSAQVVAAKRMLEDRYSKAQKASDDWYRRASLALQKGDELLAKEALKRRKAFEDSARTLKVQLEQQTGVADRILSSSRALESKISEARNKKDQLKARAASAKTSKQIQEMLGSIDTSSALAAYERMEEKVTRLEAEADALTQITSDDLTTKFAELEAGDVGDDLEQLRRELGMSQTRGQLPSWQDKVVEKPTEKSYNSPGFY